MHGGGAAALRQAQQSCRAAAMMLSRFVV